MTDMIFIYTFILRIAGVIPSCTTKFAGTWGVSLISPHQKQENVNQRKRKAAIKTESPEENMVVSNKHGVYNFPNIFRFVTFFRIFFGGEGG